MYSYTMRLMVHIVFCLVIVDLSLAKTCGDGQANCMLENSNEPTPKASQKNLAGGLLEICSLDPVTGFMRDGYCHYSISDRGKHLVCAEVSATFLEYTKSKGNDLSSANPRYGFKGLKPGDRWCLCSSRVVQANRDGINVKIIKESTNQKAWD